MKKNQLLFFAAITISSITISLSSCDKEHENEAPVVTITSPANHDEFVGGNTVHVEVTLSDDDALHEMSLEVRQDVTDSLIFACYPTVHELTSYTLDTTFTAPVVSAETEFHVEAEAIDHNNKTTSSEVHIHVMP